MKRKKTIYFFQQPSHRERQKDTFRFAPTQITKISSLQNINEVDCISVKRSNSRLFLSNIVTNYLPAINIKKIKEKDLKTDYNYIWGFIPFKPKHQYFVELENPYCLTFYNSKAFHIFKPIIRFFLKSNKCKKIVCISEACKLHLIKLLGKSIKNKTIVIYPYMKNRINKRENRTDKEIRFLFIGVELRRKGGLELLEAFTSLKNKNARLYVVGLKEDLPEKYKKDKRIINFGRVSREQIMNNIYPKVDVLMLPSMHESSGMVTLEAVSCGLGVITTNTYALQEVVENDYNGIIIPHPFLKEEEYGTMQFANPVKWSISTFYKKFLKNRPPNKKLIQNLKEAMEKGIIEQHKWKKNSEKMYSKKFSEEIWEKQFLKLIE